ncbi:glycoside hydrolase superfamily [Aspergillus pseudoustus]|uniref:Probable beta-glucosidase H n=1 Tax=Aspergillus pseudoustus TaxID=1810923 RepID=A0ABR4K0M7_9EURO
MRFDVEEVLCKLTQEQKTALVSGVDFWHTYPIPEHGVPSVRFSDGPNGVRGTRLFGGPPSTCLPCGTALGATWGEDLLLEAGGLLGRECIAKGVHCLLGPTLDILRSPLFGRGFEGLGEDPYLTGTLASAIIRGIQSTGVMTAVKHFVAYNQEYERRRVDAVISDRALREIHLRPFQIVARDAQPAALITAYNKVNGTHASQSAKLVEHIVRKEWGWNPLITSDWVGTYSTAEALNAGLDLEMPGPSRYRGSLLQDALDTGQVHQATIDDRARNMLRFARRATRVPVLEASPAAAEVVSRTRTFNRKLCAESIVLLKNEGSILPLPPDIKRIALIGSHMKRTAICGGGSAQLEPEYSVSLYDALCEVLPPTTVITYAPGHDVHKTLPLIIITNGSLEFYNDPPNGNAKLSLGTEPIWRTHFELMDYDGIAELDRDRFWVIMTGSFVPDTTGLWEFGIAVYGTANLYIDDELVIENTSNQVPGTAFFGSGTLEKRASRSLLAGQEYMIRVEFGSANTSPLLAGKKANFAGGGLHLGACPKLDKHQALKDAVAVAKEADYTIICTGLNEDWESEGFDRPDMDLPPGIEQLINEILAVCPSTVIVNQSGTPVTMPWARNAPCIVQAWYGGNETGYGIADVLLGHVNPAGKLPFSWPIDIRDNPSFRNFGMAVEISYTEEIYVGYRFYEKMGRNILFPFGYLFLLHPFDSSTNRRVSIIEEISNPTKPWKIQVSIKNTGQLAGAEVLQVYISPRYPDIDRPLKELCGFKKVFLAPGQRTRVEIPIDRYAASYWSEPGGLWITNKGVYHVVVGSSSRNILGVGVLEIKETRRWIGL